MKFLFFAVAFLDREENLGAAFVPLVAPGTAAEVEAMFLQEQILNGRHVTDVVVQPLSEKSLRAIVAAVHRDDLQKGLAT